MSKFSSSSCSCAIYMRDCGAVSALTSQHRLMEHTPSEAWLKQMTFWCTCGIILTGRYIFTAVIFEQYLDKCVLRVPVGAAQGGSEITADCTRCSYNTHISAQIDTLFVCVTQIFNCVDWNIRLPRRSSPTVAFLKIKRRGRRMRLLWGRWKPMMC